MIWLFGVLHKLKDSRFFHKWCTYCLLKQKKKTSLPTFFYILEVISRWKCTVWSRGFAGCCGQSSPMPWASAHTLFWKRRIPLQNQPTMAHAAVSCVSACVYCMCQSQPFSEEAVTPVRWGCSRVVVWCVREVCIIDSNHSHVWISLSFDSLIIHIQAESCLGKPLWYTQSDAFNTLTFRLPLLWCSSEI